jgi:hypothetical protein
MLPFTYCILIAYASSTDYSVLERYCNEHPESALKEFDVTEWHRLAGVRTHDL